MQSNEFKEHLNKGSIALNKFNDFIALINVAGGSEILLHCFQIELDYQLKGILGQKTNYVGAFATFPASERNGFEVVYLALYSIENEITLNADTQIEILSRVLRALKNG